MRNSPASVNDTVPSSLGGASSSATASTASPSPKPASSSPSRIVRDLTPSELESMRREFAASAAWAQEMIRSGKIKTL